MVLNGLPGEPTYKVSDLCGEIRDLLSSAFPSVWVVGEVQRARPSQRGHFYFELIEKDSADGIVAKIDAVIWRGDYAKIRRSMSAVDQQITEGLEIRCRVQVDFWPPGGRLQVVVREVDPVFTLGLLEQRRRQTLAALESAGLLDRNRRQALPELPLRLGLVTSHGSAAYHDFLSTLQESGFGFRLIFVHASVQGRTAEEEIASALKALVDLQPPVDAAVLIRGGGSRSDLAVFDSRRVAEAVAKAPFPVLAGLGHEIDTSIADRVAHTTLKTPTKVAEFLVERLATAEAEAQEFHRRLVREAREPLRRAAEAVNRCESALKVAEARLTAASARLRETARLLALVADSRLRRARETCERLGRNLAHEGPRFLESRRRKPQEAQRQIVALARGRLAHARATLDGLARLCEQLSPAKTLARGFSITRDPAGKALRQARQVASGNLITTELGQGTIQSRVEESK